MVAILVDMSVLLDPSVVERESMTLRPAELAGFLQDHLGQRLTAYLAGKNDPKVVGRWISGNASPQGFASARLQYAFRAARMLVNAYDDVTTKAWFVGANTRLDDEAPAFVLRYAQAPDDLRFLVPTARAFVGGID